RDVRDEVRACHDAGDTAFVEVHVSTPVEVASDRDVKGLYARQRAGELTGLTGVDDPYEVPLRPELVIPTHEQAVDESVTVLLAHLAERGLIPHVPRGEVRR
ncbi:MAG: adenylylsulfate kinase, partial [Pseudonocardiales bacterium]|nr:adenylylsulfate kinase [Pseudonocardiales bacterium]